MSGEAPTVIDCGVCSLGGPSLDDTNIYRNEKGPKFEDIEK